MNEIIGQMLSSDLSEKEGFWVFPDTRYQDGPDKQPEIAWQPIYYGCANVQEAYASLEQDLVTIAGSAPDFRGKWEGENRFKGIIVLDGKVVLSLSCFRDSVAPESEEEIVAHLIRMYNKLTMGWVAMYITHSNAERRLNEWKWVALNGPNLVSLDHLPRVDVLSFDKLKTH